MTDTGDRKSLARKTDEVLVAHREVTAVAHQIDEARDPDQLLPLLSKFRAMLSSHFADEESSGGLYDSIRDAAPQSENALARLAQQHQEMLDVAAALTGRAEGDTTDLLGPARELARQLLEHEAEENRLLLDTFEIDIGVGD